MSNATTTTWHLTMTLLHEVFNQLPENSLWDHTIDLKPGSNPIKNLHTCPISWDEEKALELFIDENLKTGYIYPSKWRCKRGFGSSKSSFQVASPFFFVKKKDGKLCTVQDY